MVMTRHLAIHADCDPLGVPKSATIGLRADPSLVPFATITFQDGPIGEAGVNGIGNEELILLVRERLVAWQGHDTARCRENAIALTHLDEALMWMDQRTMLRQAAGIEGYDERQPDDVPFEFGSDRDPDTSPPVMTTTIANPPLVGANTGEPLVGKAPAVGPPNYARSSNG